MFDKAPTGTLFLVDTVKQTPFYVKALTPKEAGAPSGQAIDNRPRPVLTLSTVNLSYRTFEVFIFPQGEQTSLDILVTPAIERGELCG